MRKFFKHFWGVCFSVALMTALLGSVLLALTLNDGLMASKFDTYVDPAVTGVEAKDHPVLARVIVSYLSGRADSMQLAISVHGEMRDAFQEHELQHMRDVRSLIQLAFRVLALCGAAVLISLLVVFAWKRSLAPCFARMFLKTSLALFAIMAAVGLWAVFDFDSLFRAFHQVAFTNELWLLNPHTDLLLQLMPLSFFISYAAQIGLWWLGIMALLALSAFLYLKRRIQ